MADFKKVLVLDDRLRVKDDIDFAVFKGARSNTTHIASAQSATTSQISFNLQVPSELTILDREIIYEGKFTLQVVGTPLGGKYLIDYGNGHALCPFPLHQMMSTATATVNNNTVSMNVQDVLEAVNRFHDRRFLARYNGMTPTAFDTYQKYSDAIDTINNSNGSYNNISDNDLVPRGCFPVNITGNTIGDGATQKTVYITFQVREPLLLSPFIFADPSTENQGIYGIQNLNFLFNIGNVSNVLRGVDNSVGGYVVQLYDVGTSDNFKLYVNYLTAPNSVLLPPRNVVPYYELPRYTSRIQDLAAGAINTISSPSLQLNQVPDKLIVFVRKQTKGVHDTNSYLPVNSISINFNNVSGLLSSSRQNDLWKKSVNSGSNQSWLEFSGVAVSHTADYAGAAQTVNTTGSMLMLDFGREISLVEEYYAPSSLGQFQLQFDLNITNNTGVDINGGNPYELVIITMNSGIFVTERGSSATYTAMLTKSDVLDASQSANTISYSDARRMVGGSVMSFLRKNLPKGASVAKTILGSVNNPKAQTASKVIGALGYGVSGGRMDSHLM